MSDISSCSDHSSDWGSCLYSLLEKCVNPEMSNWLHPDKIKDTYLLWVWSSDGEVPPNAVSGGCDNELLFIGRFVHKTALTPGKIVRSAGVCCVPWGGEEHKKSEYEVLCGCNVVWVPCSLGLVPPEALPAGRTENGEVLYIGRVNHHGATAVGKVQPTHRVCYIASDGWEIAYDKYEVLVVK